MRKTRYQFGVRSLFVLTTVVALNMTIVVTMFSLGNTQGFLTIYLLFLSSWAVMRGPYAYAELRAWNKQRCEFKARRHQLKREILEQKRQHSVAKSVDVSDVRQLN